MLFEDKLESEIKNLFNHKNYLEFTTSQIFDEIKDKLKFEESDISQVATHVNNICEKLKSENFLKTRLDEVEEKKYYSLVNITSDNDILLNNISEIVLKHLTEYKTSDLDKRLEVLEMKYDNLSEMNIDNMRTLRENYSTLIASTRINNEKMRMLQEANLGLDTSMKITQLLLVIYLSVMLLSTFT